MRSTRGSSKSILTDTFSLARSLATLAAGTLAMVGHPGAALAQDVCTTEKAKQALQACPTSGPQEFKNVGAGGKKAQVNFRSQLGPQEKQRRDIKPGSPDMEMGASQRDARNSRLKQRQKALLVTEIQQIEGLYRTTPKSAPDRVTIARRLAETYVELENAAFREKIQAEMERDAAKKSNPTAAGQKQTAATQAETVMKNARKNAIAYYSVVKNEYPNYAQLDEVLYYLAYEFEQGNDYPNARKVYYELIQKRPSSKYIPNAYLAFGELFFNEAQGDPSKWDLSAEAYKKVIGYPPPDNKVYGYAWYKLAYVKWNQGDFAGALDSFKKTIDFGNQFSQLPNAAKLADSARRDIIPVYAQKGDPAQAFNFFRNLSGDAPGAHVKTYKMMEDLGQNYLDTGHYPEAITLYKDLMVRNRGDRLCFYQSKVSEATLAMKSGNKEAVKSVLDEQAKLYAKFKNESHGDEAKFVCANRTAEILTETAMAWHLEAVGSQGQRGTGDPKTMLLAARVYKHVVDNFKQAEFEKFEFPRLVKEDWPNIYKIKYNMADLLYFQQKWDECGPAFDSVVAENPTGPEAPEAAFAAVLCYQNIYEQTHPKGSDRRGGGNLPGQQAAREDDNARFKPKDMTENQKGMVSAFNRYICYIKPAQSDAEGQEKLVEVKYARARTYFEAQHWEEAAIAFRDIAMNNADKDVGIYAAQLYLESINVLGSKSQPPRPSCFDDMGTDVPKFLELYCTGANAQKNAEQCTTLGKIQADILRLKAENLSKLAERGGPDQLSTYEKAGNSYLELYRKFCEAPKAAGKPPEADRCEELLFNAGESFQSARLLAKSIAARIMLVDPKNGYDKTDVARRAMYKIGGNYQAIAVYDLAADWFERYAKTYPRAEKADTALADAVVLRIGLGQEEQAIAGADTFQKQYGASKPTQTASIRFAIGAHYAEKEDWKKAKEVLETSMGVINRAGLDIQMQAHATLGRAHARLRKPADAKRSYTKVKGLWNDPAAGEQKIRSAYPDEDDDAKTRRLAKALTALGEAYFYLADEQRAALVEPIKFPEYKGSGSKDEVLRHIKNKVVTWYQKKKEAIVKVGPEYSKILDIKPTPPPKWVIAAGSRYGLMWGDFVDDFRRAPIPDSIKKDPELRGIYYDSLDQASEPFKVGQAKPALKKCLDLSVQYQYFDEYSRACEVWLAKNYKAEYHVVDEIRGGPTLVGSGLDDNPPPLQLGGQSMRGAAAQAPEKVGPATASDKAGADEAGPTSRGGGAPGKGGAASPKAATPKAPKKPGKKKR